MKKRALFVGNGINLLESSVSWKNMLNQIVRDMNKDGIVSFDAKPYPLLYEEIYTRGMKYSNFDENKIREAIDSATKQIETNSYHSKLMSLPFENILTTNYDYCLERSREKVLSKNNNHERKYSLFRKRQVANQSIWHIHGELDHKQSLMLGYEHYVGAMQKMRNYMTTSVDIKGAKHRSPFKRGILNFEAEDHYSWIDIFLRDDIFIVGLTLGFDEIDLWWLISYRNRQIIDKKMKCGDIYYYYFSEGNEINRATNKDEQAKIDMLKVLDIVPIAINLDRIGGEWQYKTGWDNFLKQVRRKLG